MGKKIISQKGESIGETLIALLISALALVMLAGAISASLRVVGKGRAKIGSYYDKNEESSGVTKKESGGTIVDEGIKITDPSNTINEQSFKVTYFINEEFSKNKVLSYNVNIS